MAEPLIIQDILGNSISLGPELLHRLEPDLLGKIKMAIKRPAMVVADDALNKKLHYFRSAEWHQTVLLTVVIRNNHWEVESYQLNPSNERLAEILRHGRQLI